MFNRFGDGILKPMGSGLQVDADAEGTKTTSKSSRRKKSRSTAEALKETTDLSKEAKSKEGRSKKKSDSHKN